MEPKSSSVPSKMEPKSSSVPPKMEPNPAPYLPKWSQEPAQYLPMNTSLKKRRPKLVQEAPRGSKPLSKPSQNPPQTHPKWITKHKPKNSVFRSEFFSRFLDLGSENHLFFKDFLSRSSIQISLIFEALSPAQPIVF